jgi:phage FluMu protein Com
MPVPLTRELSAAQGDVTQTMRTVRCLCCGAKVIDVVGTHLRVEARCQRCNTLIIVERPATGVFAQRFGVTPRPAVAGSPV